MSKRDWPSLLILIGKLILQVGCLILLLPIIAVLGYMLISLMFSAGH